MAVTIGSCSSHHDKQPIVPVQPPPLPAGVEIKDSMISFQAVHLNDAIRAIIQQYHFKGLTSRSLNKIPPNIVSGGANLRTSGALNLKAIGNSFDLDIRVINDSVDIQPMQPEGI